MYYLLYFKECYVKVQTSVFQISTTPLICRKLSSGLFSKHFIVSKSKFVVFDSDRSEEAI